MANDFRTWGWFKIGLFRFFSNVLMFGYFRKLVGSLLLKGHERVLELGSGTGAASVHLAKALSGGGWLFCTDISLPLQKKAKLALRPYKNVSFLLGESAPSAVPAGSVDLVFVHFVLHDIPSGDRKPVLEMLRRALKSGGRLVLREPVSAGHGMPGEEIERLMRETGFTLREHHLGRESLLRPVSYTGVFN